MTDEEIKINDKERCRALSIKVNELGKEFIEAIDKASELKSELKIAIYEYEVAKRRLKNSQLKRTEVKIE